MSIDVTKEPWRTAMQNAGLTSPASGIPSVRQLSTAINVHPATLSRLFRGLNVHPPSESLIRDIARVLDKTPHEIGNWMNVHEGGLDGAPYVPPPGSGSMTSKQREAINRMINGFVEANRREQVRRPTTSKLVQGLSQELNMSTTEVADMLERIESDQQPATTASPSEQLST